MWLNRQEQGTLTILGLLALFGLWGVLWQRHRPPLTIKASPTPVESTAWDAALESARRIDVNTASGAELERLPGVGPTLAQRIVAYRAAHGSFRAADELTHVEGIGPQTFGSLRDYVTAK